LLSASLQLAQSFENDFRGGRVFRNPDAMALDIAVMAALAAAAPAISPVRWRGTGRCQIGIP
jgi:hypothetical protein